MISSAPLAADGRAWSSMQAIDHLLLAAAGRRPCRLGSRSGLDAELRCRAGDKRSDLGAINHVLARQAGDVRARARQTVPLDHRSAMARLAIVQARWLTCFPAPKNQNKVVL